MLFNEENASLIIIFINLKLKQGSFSEKYLFLKETIDNVVGFNWWRLIDICGNIRSNSRGLLTAIGFSVERIFSLYGMVQSKKRKKLLNIYFYFVN